MTREDILAMKPGRELDALVAEKVMGWKLTWPVNPECDFSVGIHGKENFGVNPEDGREDVIPYYSTSWGDGGKVLEKMLERQPYCMWNDEDIHHIYFGNAALEAWGDAPEAIAKAALLTALEVDRP